MYGNTGLITANMKITGAMIPPIRATAEQYPIPTFLNIEIIGLTVTEKLSFCRDV